MSKNTKDLAIYIHWPFCKSKCPYCDFNSHVTNSIDYSEWQNSYLKEMSYFRDFIDGKNISSIFFGGGTPTLMPPRIAEKIIERLYSIASLDKNIEITLEGNPTSVENKKLADFKNAGVNRVSLGVQAFNDKDLKFLGREHSKNEALEAIEIAAKNFNNYSFDLIYARPEQTIKEWEEELKQAIKYTRNHLSLYQLTIEKGTSFYSEYNKGKFTLPSDEVAATLYEMTYEKMEQFGFNAYEVSNFAKPEFESKHNLTYWYYNDYLGIGPGAHSRITENGKKQALTMVHRPESWLKQIKEQSNGIQQKSTLNEQEIFEEMMMMGLRLKDGMNRKRIEDVSGFIIEEKLQNLEKMQNLNLIEIDKDTIKATQKGRMLLNSVLAEMLG